jgi:hypothetical protein
MRRYCPMCGERRLRRDEFGVLRVLGELPATLLSLDTRVVRTLDVLGRPGLLTTETLRGRRSRYLSPLQLFLLANVLFFVVHAFAAGRGRRHRRRGRSPMPTAGLQSHPGKAERLAAMPPRKQKQGPGGGAAADGGPSAGAHRVGTG